MTRHDKLYQQAKEISKRLSSEREKKEREELKECTFHPQRLSDSYYFRKNARPNSVNEKKSDILASLERLFPSKEKLNLRQQL
jgi:hypothetical protein